MNLNWAKEFDASIVITDTEGIILDMNDKAAEVLKSDGGYDLIGTNSLDCHPEPSRSMFKEMLATQREHIYTIERNGVKKMVCQKPWYKNGQYAGFVEINFQIPAELPHRIRD